MILELYGQTYWTDLLYCTCGLLLRNLSNIIKDIGPRKITSKINLGLDSILSHCNVSGHWCTFRLLPHLMNGGVESWDFVICGRKTKMLLIMMNK